MMTIREVRRVGEEIRKPSAKSKTYEQEFESLKKYNEYSSKNKWKLTEKLSKFNGISFWTHWKIYFWNNFCYFSHHQMIILFQI